MQFPPAVGQFTIIYCTLRNVFEEYSLKCVKIVALWAALRRLEHNETPPDGNSVDNPVRVRREPTPLYVGIVLGWKTRLRFATWSQ